MSHPRAIILASEIPALRVRATQPDPYGKTGYTRARSMVIYYAHRFFDGAGADPDTGEPITYTYGSVASWVRDIETQVWAGLLQDPSTWPHNYAARAIALMQHAITNWPSYRTEDYGDKRREVVRGMALAFDVFYDSLGDDRATLAAGILDWGEDLRALIEAGLAADALCLSPHYEKALTMLGFAGIAMDDEFEEAAEWVQLLVDRLTVPVEGHYWPFASGGQDGGFTEGIGYNLHAAHYRLETFRALAANGILDAWSLPAVAGIGDNYLYCQPPTAYYYGTHGDMCLSQQLASTAKTDRTMMFGWAMATGNAAWQWWAEERLVQGVRMGSTTYGPLSYDGLYSTPYHLALWLSLLPHNTLVGVAPTSLPKTKRFADTGIVAAHTNLTSLTDDTSVILRASPAPFGCFGHARYDQGSFVLHSRRAPLLVNAGFYPASGGGSAVVSWGGNYHYYGARRTRSANAPILLKRSTLASGISASDTSIPIADASGWPDGGANNGYWVWIWDADTYDAPHHDPHWEVVWIDRPKAGNSLTCATTYDRGRWGTVASAHAAGARVELVLEQWTQNITERTKTTIAASTVAYHATDEYTYAVLDITPAYNANALLSGDVASRIRRHACFVPDVDAPYLCVLDEFALGSDWIVRENLHTVRRAGNVGGVYTFLDDAPSVDQANQRANLVYGDVSARVSLFGTNPLALSIHDDSDPPMQLQGWDGEGPIATKLTVDQRVLCGFFNHIHAETPAANAHVVGMVVYPFATGTSSVPDATLTRIGDVYSVTVDDTVLRFTTGETPSFEMGVTGGGTLLPAAVKGVLLPFPWTRWRIPQPPIAVDFTVAPSRTRVSLDPAPSRLALRPARWRVLVEGV